MMSACRGKPGRDARPPVVLISVDTLRADHLPAYGYKRLQTPGIDSLRKDSILFENAYAQVPLTLPSHASLLTGLLPFENGVRDNIGFRLAATHPTVAALLKTRGYKTGAAVSSFALRRDRGLAAGFDFYDDEFAPDARDERPAGQTAGKLEGWIERTAGPDPAAGPPLFAFLHLYEPHTPYAPPEPFKTRYASNLYDGEIAAADEAVLRFLEFLKRRRLYDPALVVFLADHCEGLDDHGEDEHGVLLYRETIRVPLLVKLPASESAGTTIRTPVGLIDVLPTIARVAGAAAPEKISGRSLLPDAPGPSTARRIYSETLYPRLQLGWSDLASLSDDHYQYIEAPRPELYDLLADPGEKNDLAAGKPPAFRSLRLALEALKRPVAAPEKNAPEELERLGSLGYISVHAGNAGTNLPDPKDRLHVLKKYKRLFELFYARRDSEAVALAREMLTQDPRILSVSRILSTSLDRLGRSGEAQRALQSALDRPDPGGTAEDLEQAYGQLADLFEKGGDRVAAERCLRAAVSRKIAGDPVTRRLARILVETGRGQESLALLPPAQALEDPESLKLRGAALAQGGKSKEARAAFLSAVAQNPRDATAMFQLGLLSLRAQDPGGAREWLEKALLLEPRSPDALAALGLAQVALGDENGAFDSWTRAVALDPGQHQALFNRAVLAGRLGRREDARKGLEQFLAVASQDRYPREREEARRLLKSMKGTSPG
ncbi:MAG: sulfatase-like hydrolase/transferase [Thermoanaerobaculia bacterium]